MCGGEGLEGVHVVPRPAPLGHGVVAPRHGLRLREGSLGIGPSVRWISRVNVLMSHQYVRRWLGQRRNNVQRVQREVSLLFIPLVGPCVERSGYGTTHGRCLVSTDRCTTPSWSGCPPCCPAPASPGPPSAGPRPDLQQPPHPGSQYCSLQWSVYLEPHNLRCKQRTWTSASDRRGKIAQHLQDRYYIMHDAYKFYETKKCNVPLISSELAQLKVNSSFLVVVMRTKF